MSNYITNLHNVGATHFPSPVYQRHHVDTHPYQVLLANQVRPGYYSGDPNPQHWRPPEDVRCGDHIMTRLDFVYDYDLDSNGVFSYLLKQAPLGTNPAHPGPSQTVKMFCSSVK